MNADDDIDACGFTFTAMQLPSFEHTSKLKGREKHKAGQRSSGLLQNPPPPRLGETGGGGPATLQGLQQQLFALQIQVSRILAHLESSHSPLLLRPGSEAGAKSDASRPGGVASRMSSSSRLRFGGRGASPATESFDGVGGASSSTVDHNSSVRDDKAIIGNPFSDQSDVPPLHPRRSVSFVEASLESAPLDPGVSDFRAQTSVNLPTSSVRRESGGLTALQLLSDWGADEDSKHSCDSDDRVIQLMDALYIFCTFMCSIISVNMFRDENFQSLPQAYFIPLLAVSQAVFGAWMFSRMYLRYTENEWTVVDKPSSIRRKYLRTWFAVDLTLTLPLEFVCIGWANTAFRYLCARHFLRWIRLVFVNVPSNPLGSPRPLFSFLYLAGFLCVVAHTFAMIYRTTNANAAIAGNSISYIEALYFTIGTITSVGYLDYDPTGDNVRVFVMVMMCLGFLFLSSITALATRFLSREDEVSALMKQRKMTMHSMMQHYGIPWDLQREVVSVFPSVLHNENEQNFKNLIADLPAVVSQKVERFLRTRLLMHMTIFRNLTGGDKNSTSGVDAALFDLADVLKVSYFPPMVNILELREESAEETYFVLFGQLDVIVATADDSDPNEASNRDHVIDTVSTGGVYTQAAGVANLGGSLFTSSSCQLLIANSEELTKVILRHKVLRGILGAEADRQYKCLLPLMPQQNAAAFSAAAVAASRDFLK
jgi:hypothetical protein